MSRVPTLFALSLAVLLSARLAGAASDPGREMARIAERYWQEYLELNPTFATSIGDRRYDDRLGDNSPAGTEKEKRFLERVRHEASEIDEAALAPADRVNRRALLEEVEGQLAFLSCRFDEWLVDPREGPQVEFMDLPDYTTIETPQDARRFITRVRAMGPYLDRHIANLEAGLRAGKVANRVAVQRTIQQLDDILKLDTSEWAVMAPGREIRKWPSKETLEFQKDLTSAVRTQMRPAYLRYRDFLARRVLPAARPDDKVGMVALPNGLECYRKLIRMHTSLDKTPEELHQLGLSEVARIRAALADLGQKTLGTREIPEIQRRLRTDPAMHFANAAEIESTARATLARAKAAIPGWFGILPKADCQVKVMGMHEAPYSTIAYYRNPTMDGSRPGYYMINTYKPETRPRYEAQALAFHESIPGHHLQIAIAMELTGLPEFRKHQGVTAYVEGWGLYTERLADDMGLYSGDIDRIGMLSYDAWRACRLVVDTGLHAMGWSRQQAIDYMKDNTVLAENNIVNEVDRYIGTPGQALAYKVGQLEILRLREDARKRLGDRFDIKAFHDAVLKSGAVALPILREQVEAWVASVEGKK